MNLPLALRRFSENVYEGLASFGAGELKRLRPLGHFGEIARSLPGPGKQRRVVDGDLVVDGVGAGDSKPFHGVQGLAQIRNFARVRRLAVEVGGIDYESVAFPVPDR